MSSKLKINTRVRRLFHYIDDFEKGSIQVPAFQRDHVWKKNDKLELFESIKMGYPIGSILFWRPDFKSKEDFKKFESNNMGSYFIPIRTEDYYYILDGYQRLSTLLGCLINPENTNLKRDEDEWKRNYNIIYNLEADKFEYFGKSNLDLLPIHKVPLYRFVDGKEFFDFQKRLLDENLPENIVKDFVKKYENLSSNIIDYNIPSIDMIGGSIREAVDIFSRVNSKGTLITEDWKISAISFNKEKGFRLGTEISNLLTELKQYNFEDLRRQIIFDCIINSFGKAFFDQSKQTNLEELAQRPEFIDVTRHTLGNIKKAVKFLFEECYVYESSLLPYPMQLIFLTDFFSKQELPTKSSMKALKFWFWVTSFTSYFTTTLSQQRLAYNQFQNFLDDESLNIIYQDKTKPKLSVSKPVSKINMKSVRAKSTALLMLSQFNGTFDVGIKDIKGFQVFRLFSDYDNNNENNNILENTIVIPESESFNLFIGVYKNTKDFSFLLDDESSWDMFFITSEMKNDYKVNKDKRRVLDLRKNEILSCEKNFVNELGLEYDSTLDSMVNNFQLGFSYDLPDRKIVVRPTIRGNFNLSGKVVVTITVDENGNVIEASPGARGSNVTDVDLYYEAAKAASHAKFDLSFKKLQRGTITFIFQR